jgi:transcription antitermination factor NusG
VPHIADEVIEELKQCFESDEPMTVQEKLSPGSEVTVAEGPFMGSRGVVVQLFGARKRVQILLDFLGRTTVAEVDRKSLTVENRSMADLMPSLAVGLGLAVAA